MRVPNRVYARRHLRVDSRHFYAWKNNKAVPDGVVLYYDADYSARRELTRYGHKLESLVLGDQYEIQPDGSSLNIGANPPVDTINGEKWLRSCGAVTNLLPGGAQDFTSWSLIASNAALSGEVYKLTPTVVSGQHRADKTPTSTAGPQVFSVDLKADGYAFASLRIGSIGKVFNLTTKAVGTTGAAIGSAVQLADGWVRCEVYVAGAAINDVCRINVEITDGVATAFSGDGVSGILVRNPQLTATSYPVPYTPPGTTMPATNATTTNGSWFTLADGSPVWKALTGQPLTLATRVRMGVGSGDLASGVGVTLNEINQLAANWGVIGSEKSSANLWVPVLAHDRTTLKYYSYASSPWSRKSVIKKVTQVNTAGTQFRVGYMIEGTHTTIKWSSWVAYDGSFNPSALYRLMLGFNNPYPMWFNKIAVWKKQASDTEIMEALS